MTSQRSFGDSSEFQQNAGIIAAIGAYSSVAQSISLKSSMDIRSALCVRLLSDFHSGSEAVLEGRAITGHCSIWPQSLRGVHRDFLPDA